MGRPEERTIDLSTPLFHVSLLPRAPYEASFTATTPRVGFAFDIQKGTHAIGTGRRAPFITRPATAAFTPQGCDVFSASSAGGEYLTVEITASPEDLGFDATLMSMPPKSNLAVRRAERYASVMRRALLSETPTQESIEESALGLCDLVLSAGQLGTLRRRRDASSLTDKRLQVLNDFVEAELGQRLTVSDMAKAVGLRPRHFLRSFRAATGTTPHAYLIERRLERARHLLSASRLNLAEIAAETGFASHAHFSSTFKAALGLTPTVFRRRLCG